MQPLAFTILYSNYPGPVKTNWRLWADKYKLKAGAGKYKLSFRAAKYKFGLGPSNKN